MDTTVQFRRRQLVWRKGDAEGLLVDLEKNHVHRFDAIGSTVVGALLAGAGLEGATDVLAAAAPLEPTEARRRVRQLVAELEALGIVRVVLPAHLAPRASPVTLRRRGK